jgi:hypothetical protein
MRFDDPFDNLPGDPEEAFLLLEKHFRDECEKKINNAHQEERTDVYQVEYIAQVLGAIEELGLASEFKGQVPQIEDVSYSTYLNFGKDVKHYRTMLEIRRSRRVQGVTVKFNTAAKEKIRHHLEQLRSMFDKLELDANKKEALFDKLNALQKEVDRDRSNIDRYTALTLTIAGVIGEAVDRTKVLEVLDRIAKVIWGAQQSTSQLPAPKKPKQIEAPKKAEKRRDLDDDIPF